MPNRFWLSRAAGVTWDDFYCNYARVWTGKLPPQLAGAQIHYHLAARVTGSSQWVFADNQVLTKDRAAEFSIRLDPNGPQLDFWTDFRRACRAIRPDCWLFDEVAHSAAVQATFAGRLDSAMKMLDRSFASWASLKRPSHICGLSLSKGVATKGDEPALS